MADTFKERLRANPLLTLLRIDIWAAVHLNDRSPKGRLLAFLRMLSICKDGIIRNKLPSQAAALSYYSLIAMGPMIAIAILVSSLIIQDTEGDLAEEAVRKALTFFAAPATLNVSEQVPAQDTLAENTSEDVDSSSTPTSEEAINPDLVAFVNQLVTSARSGTAGVLGTLFLAVMSIQLIITIEKAFNGIWGTKRGRSLVQRVFFYWTVLTLGAILGLASMTLLSASALARFFDNLPLGEVMLNLLLWGAPALSVILIILLLAFFYRFMPNTYVQWNGAFLGAVIVCILLYLIKEMNSWLFFGWVMRAQTLYGPVSIAVLLMFSLFIFWNILLLGSQISYAIQNVDNLSNRRAWSDISQRTQEAIALTSLVLVSRRFQDCGTPYSVEELSSELKVPGHILNENLTLMCEMGLISQLEGKNEQGQDIQRYQPGRPLDKITLKQFKNRFESYGNNLGTELLRDIDPLVCHYLESTEADDTHAEDDLQTLLKRHPIQS